MIARMVGYCMHFYQSAFGTRLSCCVSATVWQLLNLQLYFAKASSATIANALPLQQHCLVFVVPRFLIKRLLLEMPERAKLFALHACSHYNNPLARSITEYFERCISESYFVVFRFPVRFPKKRHVKSEACIGTRSYRDATRGLKCQPRDVHA